MRASPIAIVAKFCVTALLYFALLDLAWFWIADAYAVVYRATGNFFFCRVGEGIVRFSPMLRDDDTMDTVAEFGRVAGPPAAVGSYSSSGIQGYLPTAALTAMVLATPVPWRRRLKALPVGLLLIHAFVLLRMGVMVWHWFGDIRSGAARLYEPGPCAESAIRLIQVALWESPAAGLFMPAVIWAVVLVRSEDIHRVRSGMESPRDQSRDRLPVRVHTQTGKGAEIKPLS